MTGTAGTQGRRVPLRCPSDHHGFAIDATGTHEVRCRGKYCRTAEGGTVIHIFDLATGSFVTRPEHGGETGLTGRPEDVLSPGGGELERGMQHGIRNAAV